jgi:transposase
MALAEKREEAERLYVKRVLSCSAIAAELGVDQGTVYRWKAEAAQKGDALD